MYAALLFSVENGHDDISSLLIEAGADFDIDGRAIPRRLMPLFAAVR
jgi:hypothetical protein